VSLADILRHTKYGKYGNLSTVVLVFGRRESEDDGRHRSKHKKSKKVKDEPIDEADPVVAANVK
jgi:hypothetical protein